MPFSTLWLSQLWYRCPWCTLDNFRWCSTHALSSAQVPFTRPVSPSLSSCGCWPLTVHSCPILQKIKRVEVCCLIRKCLEGYTLTHSHIVLPGRYHVSWILGCYKLFLWEKTRSVWENLGHLTFSSTRGHGDLIVFHSVPGRNSCWMPTVPQVRGHY